MERKSIGSFIAVLRKANGLTQRELADKIGVSDKAVSRWERDETAPDLYLIPVIAEIFGVTSDELLRGERAGESAPPPEKQNEKTERGIKTVLKAVRTKFLTKTLICVLIAVVGLIAAMLCNFAFYRCELGFFVGFIFFTVAVVIEIIFAVLAFSGLDAEEFESTHLMGTRKYIIKKAELLVFLAFCLFAFTLPLPIYASGTSYVDVKLDFGAWFISGAACAVPALILCLVANIAVDKIAEEKGTYAVDEDVARKRSLARFRFLSPLPGLAKVFLPIIAVTIVLNIVLLNIFDYPFFLRDKGTEWVDANEFVAYMETPLEFDGTPYDDSAHDYTIRVISLESENGRTEIRFKWKNHYVRDFAIGDTKPPLVIGGNADEYVDIFTQIFPNGDYKDYEMDGAPYETEGRPYDIPDFYAKTYTENEIETAHAWAYGVYYAFVLAYFAEGITLAVIYITKVVKNFKK